MPYGTWEGVYYIVNAQDLGYAVVAVALIVICALAIFQRTR